MTLSLLGMPLHASISVPNTNTNRKTIPSKKLTSHSISGDRFNKQHRILAQASSNPNTGSDFDAHQFSSTLDRFKPTKLEKKQYDSQVLKKYPALGIVQENLKQSSELMRSAFTGFINGETIKSQDLEIIEKHLNELPKAAWEELQNQTHIFRPIKSVGDIAHNLRTVIGIPGAMTWTSTKSIEYLTTPDEVLRNKPRQTLKEQVLDHNRYLLFPDTHSAFEAFLELGDLHNELTQRYELLKQLVNSKSSN